MKQPAFSWDRFWQMPVVGILRNIPPESLQYILPAYQAAGFTSIEITMNSPGASGMIREACAQYGSSMNIGAGTVCEPDDLEAALDAGAGFIVTPVVVDTVIRTCAERKIPIFPGAYTPTEIYNASKLGADLVKVFPASASGPGFIKELKGPLPHIRLLPTGGVNLDNCIDFLKAGAAGLGIGGQLFDKALIAERNWKQLEEHLRQYADKINGYRRMEKV